jgi:hypothetical protein
MKKPANGGVASIQIVMTKAQMFSCVEATCCDENFPSYVNNFNSRWWNFANFPALDGKMVG